MSLNVAAELHSRSDLKNVARVSGTDRGRAEVDVLEAFLEALSSPDSYRLIDRGGELFLERASPLQAATL